MTTEEEERPEPAQAESDPDKPNITVGADHEVQLKLSDHENSDEGSILAAPAPAFQIDAEKDPQISHLPGQNAEAPGQSACCLLL
jgi:hypothetical protein